jgi:uncharacterized MnhB-related membrane protein
MVLLLSGVCARTAYLAGAAIFVSIVVLLPLTMWLYVRRLVPSSESLDAEDVRRVREAVMTRNIALKIVIGSVGFMTLCFSIVAWSLGASSLAMTLALLGAALLAYTTWHLLQREPSHHRLRDEGPDRC